jgi:hypothetical protein
MRVPSELTMNVVLFMTAAPVSMVCLKAHSVSHMLARNTSEQRRPMAASRGMPVISSAARLNDETRHSPSTVKTPSEMLSRIESVAIPGSLGAGGVLLRLLIVTPRQ